jgi:K+-transporting ATPase c subunit
MTTQCCVLVLVLFVIADRAMTGVAVSRLVSGVGKLGGVPGQAVRKPDLCATARPVGSSLIGQSFQDPEVFLGPTISATSPMPEQRHGLPAARISGRRIPRWSDAVRGRIAAAEGRRSAAMGRRSRWIWLPPRRADSIRT